MSVDTILAIWSNPPTIVNETVAGLTKTFMSLGLLINLTGIPVTIVSLIGWILINMNARK